MAGGRVDKGDLGVVGATAGSLINQADALRLEGVEIGNDLVGLESDVVKAIASTLEKLADRRFGGGGLQELDAGGSSCCAE